ncbi:hypothetical protein L873DRAFT_1829461 [Choiromyces venosus 120613-1]|uniref:Uncharacterized protein n=1 Tax=Choiromyces venosus 120613-1 TaxID=1336337 RepID=A0A3N4JE08_9PEZI|nr:hypothetical protein L873DRAFT_1829461 [Choiromyces venosus 120613-1]
MSATTPTSTSPPTPSTEAHQARITLHLSNTRSLVSSWLPPPTSHTTSQTLPGQDEDEELFTPMPPRLGLGAPIPKDFLTSENSTLRTNDILKRRLMGRGGSGGSKPMPEAVKKKRKEGGSEDEDEDEGRSALGRRKKMRLRQEKGMEVADSSGTPPQAPAAGEMGGKGEKKISPPPKTRFGSYLDAHRALQAKKKKKKNKSATT